MKIPYRTLTLLTGLAFVVSCSSTHAPNQTLAPHVDIDRFMGTWYVHGYTPTLIDKDVWNATESYERLPSGKIQTIYQFNKDSADGKLKTYKPVGTIVNTDTNAEWKMRFFGLFNAAYYILYVDPDHNFTVIGHPNKNYAWIMSREPQIAEDKFALLKLQLESRGYDLSKFKRMPQDS